MSLYSEELIEEARNPKHFGELPGSAAAEAANPTCGDEVVIHIAFSDTDEKVERATFTGRGCMVTMAAASRLLEHIQGMSRKELSQVSEDDTVNVFREQVTPGRLDCVLLPYLALRKFNDTNET